jgi:transposase
MELLYQRCCGLDIHKKMLVACLIIVTADGKRHKEIRSFRTVTQDLLQLLDWLKAADCTHVAMEATGVYWKPIYNILEGHFELLVVNAQHIKAVPGHKTDVHDAEWIADLLQHGLLKSSFIPSTEQRELRDLTRYRTTLVEERVRAVNRLQKTLEDTNLKLGDVVSDILGKSGRAILDALLAGERDPRVLADLARGRLKAKRAQLEEALVGTLKPHHCFMLTQHLGHIDLLDKAIARMGAEIEARMGPLLAPEPEQSPSDSQSEPEPSPVDCQPEPEQSPSDSQPEPEPSPVNQQPEPEQSPSDSQSEPEPSPVDCQPEPEQSPLTWAQAVVLLCSIPGISQRAAEGILAEIGLQMSRFKSAKHLASWAGMCPGNHESAGKRMSGKTNKGSPWLRKLLVQAAHAAGRTKDTYLSAQYGRLAARRGKKKATIAVGHSLLVIIFHVLQEQKPYQELGGNFFDQQERQRLEKRLVQRLEKLGYEVSLEPVTHAA